METPLTELGNTKKDQILLWVWECVGWEWAQNESSFDFKVLLRGQGEESALFHVFISSTNVIEHLLIQVLF